MKPRYAVVASRWGASLLFTAGWPRSVDHDRVAQVLASHGLAYSPPPGKPLEFVAGTDLSERDSVALAADLEAVGLAAAVLPAHRAREGVYSLRVAAAALLSVLTLLPGLGSLLLGLAMLTVIPGVTPVDTGRTFTEWLVTTAVLLGVGATLALPSAVNLSALVTRGQRRLAGQPLQATDPVHVLQAIRELSASLPDHVSADLLRRAESVAARARRDPEGPAARELDALLADLRAAGPLDDAGEARALRRDLANARAAVRETTR